MNLKRRHRMGCLLCFSFFLSIFDNISEPLCNGQFIDLCLFVATLDDDGGKMAYTISLVCVQIYLIHFISFSSHKFIKRSISVLSTWACFFHFSFLFHFYWLRCRWLQVAPFIFLWKIFTFGLPIFCRCFAFDTTRRNQMANDAIIAPFGFTF